MTNVYAITPAMYDADFRRRMQWAGYGFKTVCNGKAYRLVRVPK